MWTPENEWAWEGFPEFLAFLDQPPALPEHLEWYVPFLKHLATHGEKVAAAMYARVGRSTMYRALTDDPAFAAEVDAAHAYFKARIEAALLHNTRVTGNPAGAIVRNKGEQPMKYIEKTATFNLTATTTLESIDGRAVLLAIIGDPGAPTQALASPPPAQLPATTETTEDAW